LRPQANNRSNNSSQKKLSILWGTFTIETLLVIIYLLNIPVDPKNAFWMGFSTSRLLSVALLLVALILFALFTAMAFSGKYKLPIIASIVRLNIAPGWLFIVSIAILIVCLFLLILTPPSLHGARIERLAPILFWLILCCSQVLIYLMVYRREKLLIEMKKILDTLTQMHKDRRIGYGLLFLSFLLGLLTIYYTYYNSWDEGDTYAGGWLVSKGWILYKDFFSHHFPFPYLWIGLVSKIFGASILAYRFSLLLFRLILFLAIFRSSPYPIAIGLTSLAWSLIGPLYLGNLLLYYSFAGILICSVMFVLLAILNKDTSYTFRKAIFIGALTGLLMLTDPVMIFASVVIMAFIGYSGFLTGIGRKQKLLYIISPLLSLGMVILLYTIYLLLTSSLDEFIQNAILFNTEVYSRYSGMAFSLKGLLHDILSGLDILASQYRQSYSPFYKFEYFTDLENWFFTAFFFRLSIILTSAILLLQKKYLGGFFIYLLGLALYYRGISNFHGSPFVMFSIACTCYIIQEFWKLMAAVYEKGTSPSFLQVVLRWTALIFSIGLVFMFLLLNIRIVGYWIDQRDQLSYEIQFGHITNDSGYLRQFACGNPDASLLVYPIDPGKYFFSKLTPASEYVFMTPWIAEVGEQHAISDLHGKAAIVYINKDIDIWGFPVKGYLKNFLSFLDEQYIEVDKNVYISPMLEQYCEQKQ
jgi:hypothetical protein